MGLLDDLLGGLADRRWVVVPNRAREAEGRA
jgi:hypothetical protein